MPHDRRRGDEAGEVSQAEDGQGEEARPGRQIRWDVWAAEYSSNYYGD